jgi:hypothetical protein
VSSSASRELFEEGFRFLLRVCVFMERPAAEDVIREDIAGEDGAWEIHLLSSERFWAYVPKNLRDHVYLPPKVVE